MIPLKRLFAALALFLLSAAMAHAQSSAEARISNLAIELADLDPADGIAPSITFYQFDFGPIAGYEIIDLHAGTLRRDMQTAGTPLAPVRVEQNLSDLPHTRSVVSAGISGAALADKILSASASMVDILGENTSNAYVQTQNVWFILSPHTRITFSADLSVRSSAGALAAPCLHAIAYASAVIALYSSRDNVWQSSPLYHNAVSGEDSGPGYDTRHSLSFSNTQATNGDYVLGANAVATAYTSAVIPAPVPEPASYAMLLAGLGLVAGAVTSRRSA